MLAFTLRRLGSAVLLLYLVLTATFFLIHLAPGQPSRLFESQGARMSQEAQQRVRDLYGLDQPLPQQYARWLGAVARGEWGVSFSQRRPVTGILLERMPATILLVVAGVGIELLLGFGLALAAVRRPDGWVDHGARWLSVLFYAMPVFVLAIALIELLAVQLPIFPTQQMTTAGAEGWPLWRRALDVLHHLVLPALTLGLVRCGQTFRFLRNSLLEILQQDFIRTARAKGLGERRVLWRHALPCALGPIIQRLGVSLPMLLSGTLILEVVFAWPGIGTVVYGSIFQRDYPVILAATALSAMLVVAGSFWADVVHAWVDPRTRLGVA